MSQPSKEDCSRYSWGNSSKPQIIGYFVSFQQFLGIAVNKLLENSAGERKLDNWLHPRELKHLYAIVPMEREDSSAPRRYLAPL